MRIVNRKEFLSLPEGTVFSKYQPCVFEQLEIKGESLRNDYFFQQIVDAIAADNTGEFVAKLESGEEIEMDFDIMGRDGCFDEDQLFAVWSTKDIRYLINRLERAIIEQEMGK